jgi:hypothetical protein
MGATEARSAPRVAFSTLAFPDATLASAVSLGRRWPALPRVPAWPGAQTVPVSPQRFRMARSARLNSVWTQMPRIRITMMIAVALAMSA